MIRLLINWLLNKNYSGVIDLTPEQSPALPIPPKEFSTPFTISQFGIDLIKKFEKLELVSYPDTGGVWTIGYGHTAGVKPGMTITKEKAEELLAVYLRKQDQELNVLLKDVKVTSQLMYDVISSFVYNIGTTQFAKSTFLKLLKNRDYTGAAEQLVRANKTENIKNPDHYSGWIYDNGKQIRGLVNRRLEEKQLFLESII